MTFLSGILKIVLDWALGKLTDWIGGLIRRFKRQEEIKKQAEESVQPLKDAKDAEAIDKAADDALNHL